MTSPPRPARYNAARALLIQIQSLADHAQYILLQGDERAAREDLHRIQSRLDEVRIDLAPSATHQAPVAVPQQTQLA